MSTIAPTTPHSFFEAAFERLSQFNRDYRAHRAQRMALATLMEMDASRLDDLGLNVQDVMEALHAKPAQTKLLGSRREARATAALSSAP
jgi:uncharacterized protein YjiS (DUF1127 family)